MPATLDAPPSPTTTLLETVVSKPDVSDGFFPLVLETRPAFSFSDDQFFAFCQINRDLHIEQDANGKVVIMAPAGGESSAQNGEITRVLGNWVVHDGTGRFFDSSGGFVLPNGAKRSPDAAWVLKTRLSALTPEQRKKFLPLCPDFVVELRSTTDAIAPLKAKMEEYRQNGARLGWLIDPENKQVLVYRQGETNIETLNATMTLSGEAVLPGFIMDMTAIYTPF